MSQGYRSERFEIRVDTRQLLIDGRRATLGARAFDLLQALYERRDRIVTTSELLDLVWPGVVVEENNLQVQVSTLRKLLGSQSIVTIQGRGYRFTASAENGASSTGDSPSAASSPTPSPTPSPHFLEHYALLAFKRGRIADAARCVGHVVAFHRRENVTGMFTERRALAGVTAALRETLPGHELE